VCVKQFRPGNITSILSIFIYYILLYLGVYYKSIPENDRPKEGLIDIDKYPPSLGLTVEFCAGIVDKNKSLEEIAVDEIREECGYEVKVSDIQKIISCR
jgi:UDP-sugar diphosphatase